MAVVRSVIDSCSSVLSPLLTFSPMTRQGNGARQHYQTWEETSGRLVINGNQWCCQIKCIAKGHLKTILIGETVLHALQHEIGEITAKHPQWMMSLQETFWEKTKKCTIQTQMFWLYSFFFKAEVSFSKWKPTYYTMASFLILVIKKMGKIDKSDRYHVKSQVLSLQSILRQKCCPYAKNCNFVLQDN